MNTRHIILSRKNVAYYLLGFVVLGLAVNIMNTSGLGVGAWDTVTINLRSFFQIKVGWEFVSIGMMSLLVSSIVFTIVMLYRKDKRLVFMLVPIALVALFIDIWYFLLFEPIELQQFAWQLAFYVTGSLLLPLGLTLIVKSTFPAFVFDEWMKVIVDITNAKRMLYPRLAIEALGIAIGAVFGYLTFYATEGDFGAVDIGSFVFALTLSPIMHMWFTVLKVNHRG